MDITELSIPRYRRYTVSKGNGKVRVIHSYIDKEVKHQHQLYAGTELSINKKFFAFDGRPLHDSPIMHKDNKFFIQMDISKYFDTIPHAKFNEKFPELAHMLIVSSTENMKNKKKGICQGAILSPYISNLYLEAFDEEIQARFPNMVYTRYADDIVISHPSPTFEDSNVVIETITTMLGELGLRTNKKKTQIRHSNKHNHVKILSYNIVFGTDSNYITIGRKKRRTNKIHGYFKNTKYTVLPELKITRLYQRNNFTELFSDIIDERS